MKLFQPTISILLLLLVALVQTATSSAVSVQAATLSDHTQPIRHVRRRLEETTNTTFAATEEFMDTLEETEAETEAETTEEEGPSLFQMAQSFMLTTYNVAINGLSGVARIVGVLANIAGSVGAIGEALGGGGDA